MTEQNSSTVDPNTPLRMHLALKMLREWGMGENFHGGVVATIRKWIDDGKPGPIPWPGGAIFEEWATKEGLANVDGFVGLRVTMQIVREQTNGVCRCVSCPECRGSGHVWFAFGGRKYLGSRRCDDLDEMETCEECSGSGVTEVCGKCQRQFEDFDDDNQP